MRKLFLIFWFLICALGNLFCEESNEAKAFSSKIASLSQVVSDKQKTSKQDNLNQLSDEDLKARVQNLDNHGWAIIDRIKNDTPYPISVFYNKSLHDLLPPGSVIRIKSRKKEYVELAALEEELSQNKQPTTTSQEKDQAGGKGSNRRSAKKDDIEQEEEAVSFKLAPKKRNRASELEYEESSDSQETPPSTSSNSRRNSNVPQPPPAQEPPSSGKDDNILAKTAFVKPALVKMAKFRYLAARNLAGDFRLKADTSDPNDPATRFIIRKQLDPDLKSYLGIESEVAEGRYLRMKKNNEIIFSKKSMILKGDQKSADNFSSPFDMDSHWLLYSRGVSPDDAIDTDEGRYLTSCNLKNQLFDAFASVRSAEDESTKSIYSKPKCYWYWSEGANDLRDNDSSVDYRKFGAISATTDIRYNYYFSYDHMRNVISRTNLIPLSGSPAAFDVVFSGDASGDVPFDWVKDHAGMGERIADIRIQFQGWGKNFKNREQSMKSDIGGGRIKRFSDSIREEQMYTSLEQGLMIYNHARHYEYGPGKSGYGNVEGGSLLNFWNYRLNTKGDGSIRKRVLNKKISVKYGDKVRLTAMGSLASNLTLYAINSGDVFASHDDTAAEYDKFSKIDSNLPTLAEVEDPSKKFEVKPEDLGWFYVKGAHMEGDRWNCKIGAPVLDGDVVRLEHVVTGKNLTVARGQSPKENSAIIKFNRDVYLGSPKIVVKGEGSVKYDDKPAAHEMIVKLQSSDQGVGNSNDNFVIKFSDPANSNLNVGQSFSLVHQNSKHHLWSQHAFYPIVDGVEVGFVSALFPTKDEDAESVLWVVSAANSEGMPVKDVVWGGAPDGALQDAAGDSEELEIEVVKLGLAGNVGVGETLTVNMPLQVKEPKVSGFAQDRVEDFGAEQIVELAPLLSKGIAWLDKSLSTPDSAVVFFRAKAADTGDIQVFFGNTISLDYQWKVVIGGGNNSSSYIIKRDYPGGVAVETKVAEVFKAKNPIAGAIPGQYTPYWISIDQSTILVGVGQNLGENIILAWRDPAQREPVNRVGFGSGEKPVSYAEVRVADPLDISPPTNYYFSQKQPLAADQNGILLFSKNGASKDLMFKVPGNATLNFDLAGNGNMYFFEFDQTKSNSVVLMSDADKLAKIESNLRSLVVGKLDVIRNGLNLSKFFDKQDSELDAFGDKKNTTVSPDQQKAIARKKDILDFFVKNPGHILKKFYDETSAKSTPEFRILNGLLENKYAVIEDLTLGDLKKNLKKVVELYLRKKLLGKEITFSDKAAEQGTAFILGQIVFDLKQKDGFDPLVFVDQNYIQELKSSYDKINDHYRLRFQDYETVSKQRLKNEQKIVTALKNYCSLLPADLATTDEAINKFILTNRTALAVEFSKIGASSFNIEEIHNRIKVAKNDLISLARLRGNKDYDKKEFDKIFSKIFPDAVITSYLQSISEFTDACIILEKFSQVTNNYEMLVSSKNLDSERLDVGKDGGKSFWLSFNKNRFFLGIGESVGDNIVLFYWDVNNPCENIQTVGFLPAKENPGFLSKLKLGNTVKFGPKKTKKDYSRSKRIFDYGGALEVISPYEYQLSQNDQQVQFKDIISKKTLFPGKTPQQGALYYFTLTMQKNGFPDPQWTKDPENKIKIELDRRAQIYQAKSDSLYQASTYVQGMGAIGGLIGVLASVGFAAAGQAEGSKAAELKASSDTAFRSHDSYVFTDSMAKMGKLAKDSIPPQALANRDKASDILDKVASWLAADAEKLQHLIPLYMQILDLITHPAVIEEKRNILFSGLNSIYKANDLLVEKAKTIDISAKVILELFFKAYNNPYLITDDSEDINVKKTWYTYIGDLARKNIEKSSDNSVSVPATYGEYIWLQDKFKKEGVGSVSFSARANNDIFVCFAQEPVNVRNSDKDIYEIVFGAWDNSKTVIRSKSLDKSVAETQHPDSLVNPIDFKQYWVSFNRGKIVLGSGEFLPENAIGLFNPETHEITPPEWSESASSVELNKEWLKLVIGDETGFIGKEILMEKLYAEKDEDAIYLLKKKIIALREQIAKLAEKGIYPYQIAAGSSAGSYSVEPFSWEDPYFDKLKNRINCVGLGSWDSEVTFKDIRIGTCIEEAGIEPKNLACALRNSKDMPIYDEEDLVVAAYRKKIKDLLKQKEDEAKDPSDAEKTIIANKIAAVQTMVDNSKTILASLKEKKAAEAVLAEVSDLIDLISKYLIDIKLVKNSNDATAIAKKADAEFAKVQQVKTNIIPSSDPTILAKIKAVETMKKEALALQDQIKNKTSDTEVLKQVTDIIAKINQLSTSIQAAYNINQATGYAREVDSLLNQLKSIFNATATPKAAPSVNSKESLDKEKLPAEQGSDNQESASEAKELEVVSDNS